MNSIYVRPDKFSVSNWKVVKLEVLPKQRVHFPVFDIQLFDFLSDMLLTFKRSLNYRIKGA